MQNGCPTVKWICLFILLTYPIGYNPVAVRSNFGTGTDLITKYQAIHRLGVVVSDVVSLRNGVVVSDHAMLTSGVVVSDGAVVSDGTILGSGMFFLPSSSLFADGDVVSTCVVASNGVVESDTSLTADSIIQTLSSQNTGGRSAGNERGARFRRGLLKLLNRLSHKYPSRDMNTPKVTTSPIGEHGPSF